MRLGFTAKQRAFRLRIVANDVDLLRSFAS
jgi:hypothetical protein